MEDDLNNELLLAQIASEDEARMEQMPQFQYYQLVMDTNETDENEKNDLQNDVFYVKYNGSQEDEEVNADEESMKHEIENNSNEQFINVSNLEPITLPDGSVAYLATNGPETVKTSEIEDGTVFLNAVDQEELINTEEPKEISVTLPDGSIAYLVTKESLGANDAEVQENTEYFSNISDFEDSSSYKLNRKEIEVTLDNDQTPQVKLIDGSLAVIELKTLRNFLSKSGKTKEADVASSEPEVLTPPPVKKRKRERVFNCTFLNCEKIYTTQHHLKVHERTHTGDRPFKCEVEGCNKAFMTTYSFKIHSRIHTGEKPYACEVCMKMFYTSGDLQKHVRVHTGERPFVCPMAGCNLAFTTSNIRKVHMRTHTGERPFKCTYPTCDKSFVSKTNFKNHLRIHSGERPYLCNAPGCLKRFTEYSSLYKHQIVHRSSNQKNCFKCGAFYWQRAALKQHMKTCDGTKPIKHDMPPLSDPMATLTELTAKMSPTMTLTSADIDVDVDVDVDDSQILLSSQTDEFDNPLQLETEETELGDVFYISKHGNLLPTVHLLDE